MKAFKLLTLILISQASVAQIKVTKLAKADIPASVKYVGHIVDAVKFNDADGEHLVITTETGQIPSKTKDSDGRDADLWAYCYKMTDGTPASEWQMHDFVHDCGEDIVCRYQPNTFAVTDLDNDGKAEVWLMYRIACRGDVSPALMKVIMHQATKKYAARGTVKTLIGPKSYMGGTYAFDEAFKTSPEVFRNYAADLWKKNMLENWK